MNNEEVIHNLLQISCALMSEVLRLKTDVSQLTEMLDDVEEQKEELELELQAYREEQQDTIIETTIMPPSKGVDYDGLD